MAESNRQRRVFPDAFKLEAVAAVQDGRSVSQVAAELGLPDRLVRSWLRWAAGRRRAAWARARRIRPPRSRSCGVNSTASRWSATS
jgi:transposase-like protein